MSDLIPKMPDSVVRGITLNNQHMDLFEIIDDNSKSEEQKRKAVVLYLQESKKNKENKKGIGQLVSIYVDYTKEKLHLTEEEKEKLITTIKENINSVFDRNAFVKVLAGNGLDNAEEINSTLMEATDSFLNRIKEGITDFIITNDNGQIDEKKTYNKVKAFYDYVLSSDENGRRNFNRINFDDIAAPTGYMAIQNDFTRPKKLEKAMDFCKRHDFTGKINSAFFYMHSHYPSNPALKTREDIINYYMRYFKNISKDIQNSNVKSYDIFNEFVYRDQPQLLDNGEIQYGERHNGMHALLSVEDFCNIAKKARQMMPNVEFLYNDDGWDTPEKREGIFREIEKIKSNEDYEGQLVNSIGMQFHTSINRDYNEIRKAVQECKRRFPNLNINITELDISEKIDGFDYEHASNDELQAAARISNYRKKQMMNEVKKLASEGEISELTLWSQSDEMCFKGKDSKASLIGYDSTRNLYFGKGIEITRGEQENYEKDLEIVLRNILLKTAKDFKSNDIEAYKKVISKYMPEVLDYFEKNLDEVMNILKNQKSEPVQDFNLHTHTMRCGHADNFAEDFEYVNEALKAGMKRIAFTDHVPFPKGLGIEPNARMQYEEIEDYFASIEYLKREYEGIIDVESGFEFEYDSKFEDHLLSLKNRSDLMILGQHFVRQSDGNKKYISYGSTDEDLDKYANNIITAMEKGLPDIIAHPDLFMRGRKQWGAKEIEISKKICDAAVRFGIPLEINMGELPKNKASIKENLQEDEAIRVIAEKTKVPNKKFWEIAQAARL